MSYRKVFVQEGWHSIAFLAGVLESTDVLLNEQIYSTKLIHGSRTGRRHRCVRMFKMTFDENSGYAVFIEAPANVFKIATQNALVLSTIRTTSMECGHTDTTSE